MCGRYVLYDMGEKFPVDHSLVQPKPRYNVAPTQEVPAIIREEGRNILVPLHWGLVPFWAKDKKIGSRIINAHMETLATKPAFRPAIKHRRCLIPANAFYEWKEEGGHKQPYYITPKPEAPFAFAGIWEVWDKEDPPYRSFALITTDAAPSIENIHNRMPVILKPEFFEAWLDPDSKNPMELLETGMVREMKYYPVSTRVNKAKDDDPGLIKPVGENR